MHAIRVSLGAAFAVLTGCGSVPSPGAATDAATGAATDAATGAATDAATDAGSDAARTWSAFTEVGTGANDSTRTPVVSGDGLTLYFSHQNRLGMDVFDMFTAGRTTTDGPFGSPSPLAAVNVTDEQQRYPDVSDGNLELYFSLGDTGLIVVAARASTSQPFSAPVAIRGDVRGNFPSISGDRLALYFIAQISGIDGELRRTTRVAINQPWSVPVAVPLSGAVSIYASIDVSRDELAILRAPTDFKAAAPAPVIQRRGTVTDAFGGAELLPGIDISLSPFISARWSNGDTQVWVGEPSTSLATTGTEQPFVSTLQ